MESLNQIEVKMVNNARNKYKDIKPKFKRDEEGPKFGLCVRKFFEFCKRTDLHGFKYIVMEELNRFERGCWAFAVFLSIICAGYFVVTAYRWYARNPIVTLSPASSCNDLIERCMWKNTLYRCEQLFQQIFTSFNLCCTFNYFAVDVPEGGRKSDLIYMPSPRRVASCGYQTALTVLIRNKPEDYYSTVIASQGTVVFVDNAYNLPDLDSPVRLVNPSTEVLIALTPESTYTTPGIKLFSSEERQCYYKDEIKIGEFHQYSYHNCMALQKVEIIRYACNCIPYSFPLRNKDFSHTCNFHDLECLEKVLMPIEDLRTREKFAEPYFKCLPECEHYDYPLEVALGKLAMDVPLSGLPFFNNIELKNRSILNVFFNDLVSTRYRRDVYLNWQNILAAFGGLLSLMLGFTLISGFDFVLFFTFRVFYDLIATPVADEEKNFYGKPKLAKGSKLHVEVMNKKIAKINNTVKENDKWYRESRNVKY